MANLIDGYTGKYVSIYFWRGVSILLNLVSMIVVIPRITMYPSIYGIYSVCIATTIFLTYADLGFLGAATKYAGEYFARGELEEEKETIGFAIFILTFFVGFTALLYFYFSTNPTFIISDLNSKIEVKIASSLLFIQGIFSINLILRRFVNSVFGIRIEEYIIQRIFSVSNVIKISSVFYFFSESNYDIVGYFFFIKFVELVAIVTGIVLIHKKYDYNIPGFLKYINFNKKVFLITKDLAISSFYVTLTYVLYFEIDQIVISIWFGVESVAIYAIGITLLNYYRTLSGVIFSPFQHRYNHFIGLKNIDKLRSFLKKVLHLTYPIIVLPTLTLMIFLDDFIYTWVGADYNNSITLSRVLISTGFFIFIIVPGSHILVSLKKIRPLYILNTLMVTIFWIGILIFGKHFGIITFAVFKFIIISISFFYYLYFFLKFLNVKFLKNILIFLKHIYIPVLLITIVSTFIKNNITFDTGFLSMITLTILIILISTLGVGIYFLINRRYKNLVINIYKQIQLD